MVGIRRIVLTTLRFDTLSVGDGNFPGGPGRGSKKLSLKKIKIQLFKIKTLVQTFLRAILFM
jgi:hypothetical protein